jgi:hypothetical protein
MHGAYSGYITTKTNAMDGGGRAEYASNGKF